MLNYINLFYGRENIHIKGILGMMRGRGIVELEYGKGSTVVLPMLIQWAGDHVRISCTLSLIILCWGWGGGRRSTVQQSCLQQDKSPDT